MLYLVDLCDRKDFERVKGSRKNTAIRIFDLEQRSEAPLFVQCYQQQHVNPYKRYLSLFFQTIFNFHEDIQPVKHERECLQPRPTNERQE